MFISWVRRVSASGPFSQSGWSVRPVLGSYYADCCVERIRWRASADGQFVLAHATANRAAWQLPGFGITNDDLTTPSQRSRRSPTPIATQRPRQHEQNAVRHDRRRRLQLDDLVAQAQGVVRGVEPQGLRDNTSLRQQV